MLCLSVLLTSKSVHYFIVFFFYPTFLQGYRVCSFARTAHSFSCPALLALLACYAALFCSLTRSPTYFQARKKVKDLMSQNQTVMNHSATYGRIDGQTRPPIELSHLKKIEICKEFWWLLKGHKIWLFFNLAVFSIWLFFHRVVINCFIHSFTHQGDLSFSYSFIQSVLHSFIHSLTQWILHPFIHSFIHSFKSVFIHPLWPTLCGLCCHRSDGYNQQPFYRRLRCKRPAHFWGKEKTEYPLFDIGFSTPVLYYWGHGRVSRPGV